MLDTVCWDSPESNIFILSIQFLCSRFLNDNVTMKHEPGTKLQRMNWLCKIYAHLSFQTQNEEIILNQNALRLIKINRNTCKR